MEEATWLTDAQIRKKIGQKLKEWRLEMNYKQTDLARKTQLSLITYQKMEHGEGGSLNNLLRILRVLGHLDIIAPFLEERHLSPIAYQEIEQGVKQKQRASKSKSI